MTITLLGASGHVGGQAAQFLLDRGQAVRVVGRRAEALKPLAARGAEVRAGDLRDARFLRQALAGSDAALVMIPPDYTAPDMLARQGEVGEAIRAALAETGVPKVVSLSSVGAELPAGTGNIRVLHAQEQRLNTLASDVLHLRAAYFMENLLHAIPVIRAAAKLLDMYSPGVRLNLVASRDIAAAAAAALAARDFTGKSVRYALGPRALTMSEVAPILGAAIGQPQLVYEQVPAEAVKQGMRGAGFSAQAADLFEEMANAFNSGLIATIDDARWALPTSLETFAREVFAPAWQGH